MGTLVPPPRGMFLGPKDIPVPGGSGNLYLDLVYTISLAGQALLCLV
jgi:hypothetical protein